MTSPPIVAAAAVASALTVVAAERSGCRGMMSPWDVYACGIARPARRDLRSLGLTPDRRAARLARIRTIWLGDNLRFATEANRAEIDTEHREAHRKIGGQMRAHRRELGELDLDGIDAVVNRRDGVDAESNDRQLLDRDVGLRDIRDRIRVARWNARDSLELRAKRLGNVDVADERLRYANTHLSFPRRCDCVSRRVCCARSMRQSRTIVIPADPTTCVAAIQRSGASSDELLDAALEASGF